MSLLFSRRFIARNDLHTTEGSSIAMLLSHEVSFILLLLQSAMKVKILLVLLLCNPKGIGIDTRKFTYERIVCCLCYPFTQANVYVHMSNGSYIKRPSVLDYVRIY